MIELKLGPYWLFSRSLLWFATGYFTFTFPVGNGSFAVHPHLHFCSWIASRHFLNKRQPKLQARDSGIWWAWRLNVNYRFCWNTSRKLEIARMKLIFHFWWGTLGKMQLMLRKAAKALYAVRRINIFISNNNCNKLLVFRTNSSQRTRCTTTEWLSLSER